jgi:hypothetical protein
MRITSFWARGYRSLRDVRIDGLGPINVFYGPNGAGKSNVLAGLHTLLRVAAHRIAVHHQIETRFEDGDWLPKLFRLEDIYALDDVTESVLGATIATSDDKPLFAHRFLRCDALSIEVALAREPGDRVSARVTALRAEPAIDLLPLWSDELPDGIQGRIPAGESVPHVRSSLRQDLRLFVSDVLGNDLYFVIPASRIIGDATPAEADEVPLRENGRRRISRLLHEGRLKEALVVSLTSPNPMVRQRLEHLRSLLAGPPLGRPPFDPVHDFERGRFELQERVERPDGRAVGIPVELAGLGIQQVYVVLAHILLAGTDAVAVEEPEAHLHAPTTGRDLRQLMRQMVDRGHLKQLFVATHSNLFDLDLTGYFDVRVVPDRGTIVERRVLADIDRRHLYEPGPAKHGLLDLREYLPEDTVVFRRADGRGITVSEMHRLLLEDDADALAFLRDVVDTAVRAIQLRHARGGPA